MKADVHADNPVPEQVAGVPNLTASHAGLPALWDGLPAMVFLARADKARTIEMASAGCQTLLGVGPAAIPFSLASFIHPDDRAEVLEMVKTCVTSQKPYALEYRVQHADGHWRAVWEQGRPVEHHGHAAVQGCLTNVTRRLRREQERLRAELQALQAQKFYALNHLSAGVAHEFNNLIAGILGSAELLVMDMPEGHPGHETLKQIFEASNLARDFVHKLRALGQRPAPEFKPIRLQPVIEECLQILRSIIPPKVELQPKIAADCPKVNADAAQIHQAIMDLCLYSWQGLADRRGRIQVSLETCPEVQPPAGAVCRLFPGPHVCIAIKDDGPGLDKAAREHIFHPFRSRRSGGKKVGLELFLVRETIQGHHGEIFLENEPGHGLTFRIYLPVAAD